MSDSKLYVFLFNSLFAIILFGLFFIADACASPVQIDYTYDALGRLILVKDPVNGDRNYNYDAAGNRNNVSIGNNTIPPSSNNPPVAKADFRFGSTFQLISINALVNDSDPDGDVLAITGLKLPPSGCSINSSKTLVVCFFATGGDYSFKYVISDGKGGSDQASIIVTVSTSGGIGGGFIR